MSQKILIVEDEPQIMKLMETVLLYDKYQVVKAANGREAIAQLRSLSNDFDLIITDFNLPDVTGKDLSELSRSQEHTARIPILLISAEQAHQDFARMHTEGKINAYLAKPFSIVALSKTVKLLLQIYSTKEPVLE